MKFSLLIYLRNTQGKYMNLCQDIFNLSLTGLPTCYLIARVAILFSIFFWGGGVILVEGVGKFLVVSNAPPPLIQKYCGSPYISYISL